MEAGLNHPCTQTALTKGQPPRRSIPAILITADRSLAVTDQATVHDIHVLRKPVKPAALRAAMSHLEIKAVAGE